MKKIVILLVLFSVTLFAEINLEIVEEIRSCKVLIINNSTQELPLNGYRLISSDTSWDSITSDLELYVTYYYDETLSSQFSGDHYFHQVNFKYPYNAIIAPGDTIEIVYHYSSNYTAPYAFGEGGMLDGEHSPVILKRLINHYKESLFKRTIVRGVEDIVNDSNYYNSYFRYYDKCGDNTGGLFDDFKNITQIMLPISDSTCKISMSDVTFDPTNGGLMYWMTLAMGQEYFNLDMQYMIAMGMKETFAAVGPDNYYNDGLTGVYGPFQVEGPTAHSRMIAYKDLFPYSQNLMNGYYKASRFISENGDIMYDYFAGNNVELSSPEIVSAYIFSMINNLYIDEILRNCTEFNWNYLHENSLDTLLRINTILASYNLGIFGGAALGAKNFINKYDWYLNTANASDSLPMGNGNYRADIIRGVKHLEKLSLQSTTDLTVGIYDQKIKLEDLQVFLFGEGGSANSQASTGGMCKHFQFDHNELWNDVVEVFDFLKGKAPSTSGEDAISYRFDFLTVLRVMAKHIKIEAKFYGDADALEFTEKFSTNYESKDLIPPTILYDGHTYYNSRYCYVYCRLFDNEALYSLQYSDTANWLNIHNSDNPIWSLDNNIFIDQEFDEIISPSNPAWFFATDTSGNCTISKTEFSNTSNKSKSNFNNLGMNVFRLNGYIKINLAKPSNNLKIKIHDLKGRVIKNLDVKDCIDIRISTKGLSKGLYLFKLESDNSSKTFKINLNK